jgi:hypothetical protein
MSYNSIMLAIRRATIADRGTLDRLCALDSAPLLRGEALLAFVDDEPWAAIALDDGRVVADPFRPTAQAVELLRLRLAHLGAGAPRGRLLARALRLRGAPSRTLS